MDYIKEIRPLVGHRKIILNAAGAIITREGDDKILFQRRSDNGNWSLVGGLMEIGETYAQTALREIREETGLEVRLDYLVGVYHNFNAEWPNGDAGHVVNAVYKATILSGEPRIDEESLELRFFAPDELPFVPSQDYQEAIRDYFKGVQNRVL